MLNPNFIIDILNISWEIAFRWMQLDLTDVSQQ